MAMIKTHILWHVHKNLANDNDLQEIVHSIHQLIHKCNVILDVHYNTMGGSISKECTEIQDIGGIVLIFHSQLQ